MPKRLARMGELKARQEILWEPVPKAVVVFKKGDFTREVISDEDGSYQIDLPAGVYEVTVAKFNIFDAYRRKNVKVQTGKLKKFDVVLKYDVKKHPPVTLRRP
ncbi:MAG TPA: carboxypeptidase-like regulatory domain-containing protein [Pyrinomonadaceae bacterium]|nr:carboxypeptidase-like regulatory domain-containing protein [Pyrinomonadaceae bacterium]